MNRTFFFLARALFASALMAGARVGLANTGGLDRVASGLTLVQTTMLSVSGIIITIAIIWAGWQLLYEGKSFSDIARIFFGAILIGAAPGLAALFVS